MLQPLRIAASTISASNQEKMHKGFMPMLAGFKYADFDDLESAKALMDSLLFVWGRKFGAQLQPQTGTLVSERLWDQAIEIPI